MPDVRWLSEPAQEPLACMHGESSYLVVHWQESHWLTAPVYAELFEAFIWILQPQECTLAWIGSFGRSFSCKWEGRCDTLWPWGKRWMAVCVRLSLADRNLGWSLPRGANKGRLCLGWHDKSVVCNPVYSSFFPLPWDWGQRTTWKVSLLFGCGAVE